MAGISATREVLAVCEGREGELLILSQRNRFFRGETADILEPGKQPYNLPLDELFDEEGQPLEVAPHPMMRVFLKTEVDVPAGAILRRFRRPFRNKKIKTGNTAEKRCAETGGKPQRFPPVFCPRKRRRLKWSGGLPLFSVSCSAPYFCVCCVSIRSQTEKRLQKPHSGKAYIG